MDNRDFGQRVDTRSAAKLGYNESVVLDTTQYILVHKLLEAVLTDSFFKVNA